MSRAECLERKVDGAESGQWALDSEEWIMESGIKSGGVERADWKLQTGEQRVEGREWRVECLRAVFPIVWCMTRLIYAN